MASENHLRGKVVLGLSVLFLSTLLFTGVAQDKQQDKVAQIMEQVESSKGENLAKHIAALDKLEGKAAGAAVQEYAGRENPYVRLAAATYLWHHDAHDVAADTFLAVLKDSDTPVRRQAAELFAYVLADKSCPENLKGKIAKKLTAQADKEKTASIKVLLLRSAYLLTEELEALDKLRELVKSDNKEAREKSALALAEFDQFTDADAVLRQMEKEPTENGKVAKLYLKVKSLQDQMLRSAGGSGDERYRVLDEMISTLKKHYYNPEKIDEQKLIDAAAKGMASSLDPYTAYYDEKMLTDLFGEGLEGHYGGIGARVSMRKEKNGVQWLTVEEPIFGGPAYRQGLHALDRIIGIYDDAAKEWIATANKDINDLIRKLRGEPSTEVRIKVWRRGWKKEREFSITRGVVQLETTIHRLLPGNIGYIKLTTFGPPDKTLAEVKKALVDLAKQGAKGLIFDLRGNSGGFLSTVEKLSELFLDNGKKIVSTKGHVCDEHKQVAEVVSRHTPDDSPVDWEMVVLVDGGSASASEIMAGALRDNDRAILVGEKTFGKGSVQDIMRLESTGKKTALRLTIAKWFRPNGESIEKDDAKEGGIKPDVEVALAERSGWKEEEWDKLRQSDKIDGYFKKFLEPDLKFGFKDAAWEALFKDLASDDVSKHLKGEGVKFKKRYRDLFEKLARGSFKEFLEGDGKDRIEFKREYADIFAKLAAGKFDEYVEGEVEGKFKKVDRDILDKCAQGELADAVIRDNDAYRFKNKEFQELFERLAENDNLEASQYPDFEALYSSLNTKLEKDDVREFLREYTRKYVADVRGQAYVCDYENDAQLQRAIRELCQKLQLKVEDIAEYKKVLAFKKADDTEQKNGE